MALFSAGLKLDRELTRRAWSSTARLLLIAMPITIGLVALLGSQLLGLSAGAALLLGACIAPTDPVLAGDIGVGPPGDEDEHEPNFALTSEAGLNDGLAFPFVLAALFMIGEGGSGWIGEWLAADVVYGIVVGVAIGAAIGLAAAWSVKRLRDARPAGAGPRRLPRDRHGARDLRARRGRRRVRLPGRVRRRDRVPPLRARPRGQRARARGRRAEREAARARRRSCCSDRCSRFGGLGTPGWEGWLLAALVLVAVRPLACVARSRAAARRARAEKTFVAWFGVRGVGSLFYVAIAVEAGVLAAGERDLVVWTVIACVLLSIVVHGITAGPSMRRLLAPR